MARFRIREDARKWFKNISGTAPFSVEFDQYYLCLMAGFASGRTHDSGATDELVESFVDEYKAASRFLVGLLITAELKKNGINVEERDSVRALFQVLVDPQSPNQMTTEGMRRMNAYANGGYEYLAEQRDAKPSSSDEFLRDYVQLIEHAVENQIT